MQKLNIEKIMLEMEEKMEDIYKLTEYDLEGNDFICDIITEIADSNVPIYNENLLNEVKNLYFNGWIDEALMEFNSNDFITLISYAYYLKESSNLYDNLEDMVLYAALYIIEEDFKKDITLEELETLKVETSLIDSNDCLCDIYNIARATLQY